MHKSNCYRTIHSYLQQNKYITDTIKQKLILKLIPTYQRPLLLLRVHVTSSSKTMFINPEQDSTVDAT